MCRLVSYNVANLNTKLKFGNFFTYINNFDIIFLFETHVIADKRIQFSSFFKNYVLYWVDATKNNVMGRAIGGGLFGFKKNIQHKFSLEFCEFPYGVTLYAKFNDIRFHFIPSYLNCTNWSHDFEKLESLIRSLNDSPFCIIGDLNARVSDSQILDENLLIDTPLISQNRFAKDRTVDSKGKKLLALLENIGGIIVNGRMAGDSGGENTFCGVMGSSLIDYCICSLDILKLLFNFEVPSKPFSDHMPLVVSLSAENNPLTRDMVLPQKLPWIPKYIDRYNVALSSLSDIEYLQSNLCAQEKVNICTEKIRTAVGNNIVKIWFDPKNKWYDSQCENARKCMLRHLNHYRKTNSEACRKSYVESRSNYSKICEQKKIRYKLSNIEKLNHIRNSSDWWKLANSMKNVHPKVGNNLTSVQFYSHFKSLLCNIDSDCSISWSITNTIDPFLDSPFEMRELILVLKTAKLNKAPGQDRISYEFYKNAPSCFLNELISLYNIIFLREDIPDSFRRSIIIPLFKKGDINNVSNYRGLSLLDTIYKIFTGLILNRINTWIDVHCILNEYQAGFRKNYSTVDNLFNITSIVNLNFLKKMKTYAFFIDFSSAFDMIPRNSLFYKLCCSGLSRKLVMILQGLYSNTTSQVWDGSTISDPFTVSQGVKQGCLLSPVLFSLYLNDLHNHLPGGISVAGTVVKVLLYADDIVLLAESPTILQEMIDVLYSYCSQWSLKVNLDKSKIMVFRECTRISRDISFTYGNNLIEIVNEYKYLGIILKYNLSFKKHLESKLASSKIAINSTWLSYIHNPQINITNKLKIFHSAAKSIMFYGTQVWGFRAFDEVEKLLRYFLKKMLYLPKNTPNYMLHLETGLPSLYLETLNLHFSYIRKILKLPTNRLPRLLAEETIRQNTSWVPYWRSLYNESGITFDIENLGNNISQHHILILDSLRDSERDKFVLSARNSRFHDMYSSLQYNINPYFCDKNSAHHISLILKARGGLLNLNARSFRGSDTGICSLCNCNEMEDTYHFLGICPIFLNYRLYFFGKRTLLVEEVQELLNGKDYMRLYNFVLSCLKYRKLIINEFN